MGGVSVALLMFGIAASMFLYISLVLSPARENSGALDQWNKLGIPVATLLYLNTVIAIILFFLGSFGTVHLFAPHLRQQIFIDHIGGYVILVPFVTMSLIFS